MQRGGGERYDFGGIPLAVGYSRAEERGGEGDAALLLRDACACHAHESGGRGRALVLNHAAIPMQGAAICRLPPPERRTTFSYSDYIPRRRELQRPYWATPVPPRGNRRRVFCPKTESTRKSSPILTTRYPPEIKSPDFTTTTFLLTLTMARRVSGLSFST